MTTSGPVDGDGCSDDNDNDGTPSTKRGNRRPPVALSLLVPFLALIGLGSNYGAIMKIAAAANGDDGNGSDNNNLNNSTTHQHRLRRMRMAVNLTTALPSDPRIYVIHIGKTGGVTLTRKALGATHIGWSNPSEVACRMERASRNNTSDDGGGGCRDMWLKHHPESIELDKPLARHVLGFFHIYGFDLKDRRRWVRENTNVFLYTVRDPVDRLVSAYNYHRNARDVRRKSPEYVRLFEECFPEGIGPMIDFLRGRRGGRTNDGGGGNNPLWNRWMRPEDTRASCARTGWKVLNGEIRGISYLSGGHFQYGYRYYKEYSIDRYPDRAVAAIRTEHMWEDVAALNVMLGGNADDYDKVRGDRVTHGSEGYKHRSDLADDVEALTFVCCALHGEMEAYQSMVLMAFNLDDAQKRDTLTSLYRHCRIEGIMEKEMLEVPFDWDEFRWGSSCKEYRRSVII